MKSSRLIPRSPFRFCYGIRPKTSSYRWYRAWPLLLAGRKSKSFVRPAMSCAETSKRH